MKFGVLLLMGAGIGTFLTVGCTQQATPKSDSAAMVESAKKLDAAFVEAFNKHDADAMAALYSDSVDTVSFPPDVMKVSGGEIKSAINKSMEGMKDAKIELIETHYIPYGEVVGSWGFWKTTWTTLDGKPMESRGRYTDLKGERNGKWVYLMDHASIPVGPPPAK